MLEHNVSLFVSRVYKQQKRDNCDHCNLKPFWVSNFEVQSIMHSLHIQRFRNLFWIRQPPCRVLSGTLTIDGHLVNAHDPLILHNFTALHEMQTRSSNENSVCPFVQPSVRPSVCQTRAL